MHGVRDASHQRKTVSTCATQSNLDYERDPPETGSLCEIAGRRHAYFQANSAVCSLSVHILLVEKLVNTPKNGLKQIN